jgi:hypothetical protein
MVFGIRKNTMDPNQFPTGDYSSIKRERKKARAKSAAKKKQNSAKK